MSVKRSIRSERPEAVLFERSEFTDDSERRMLSSEADAALIFWLLFYQEKSNIQICQMMNRVTLYFFLFRIFFLIQK